MDGEEEAGKRLLQWTGERCLPWLGRMEVVYEHLHRYAFAAHLAAGRDVLDAGSGEGYGTALLAETARHVTGVDLDPDSVAHAAASYGAPNIDFVQGSVLDLARFPSASMGLAVCFEVVEHLGEQEMLVEELRRVVGEKGIVVMSTPDRSVYRDGEEPNPYHVRELDRDEFVRLLGAAFREVRILEQRPVSGSVIWSAAEGFAGGLDGFEADLEGGAARVRPGSPRGLYLLGVASEGDIPSLPAASVLSDEQLLQPFRREIDALHLEVERARRQLQLVRQELEAMRATRAWRALEAARRVASPLWRPGA
ncbi:MAG: class I SAM-dependent methyltransferase [Candidatus Dormibacterales bacterium]